MSARRGSPPESTGQSLYDKLTTFFTTEEWAYDVVEEGAIVHLTFRGERVEFDCYAQAIEEDTMVLFYSVAPFEIPEAERGPAIEFLMRMNDGLPIGNFEMSFTTNLVRFKTSVDVAPNELTESLLRSIVGANLAVMEHALPGVRAVVFAGARPEAVADELES